jgi:hypothetical protein
MREERQIGRRGEQPMMMRVSGSFVGVVLVVLSLQCPLGAADYVAIAPWVRTEPAHQLKPVLVEVERALADAEVQLTRSEEHTSELQSLS